MLHTLIELCSQGVMCGVSFFILVKWKRTGLAAEKVLVALTIGVKNQSLETTREILTHELPPSFFYLS